MTTMMKCGHAANARDELGNPVCAVCYGITTDAVVVVEGAKVEGRMMRCSYGHGTPQPSDPRAAFFRSVPNEPYDEFYCGCWGWD